MDFQTKAALGNVEDIQDVQVLRTPYLDTLKPSKRKIKEVLKTGGKHKQQYLTPRYKPMMLGRNQHKVVQLSNIPTQKFKKVRKSAQRVSACIQRDPIFPLNQDVS